MKQYNLKFSELPFVIPQKNRVIKKLQEHLDIISNCNDGVCAYKAIKKWEKYLINVSTQISIITIRYSQHANENKYIKAQAKMDELSPIITNYVIEYNKIIANAKYRLYLEEKFGKYYFTKIDNGIKTFNSSIIEDAILENKLVSKYDEIISLAKIEFDNKTINLSQLSIYLENSDREIRIKAAKAFDKWLSDNDQELGDIYSQLVMVRDSMAKKLGFNNYIELAYLSLGRSDYTASDVKRYRDYIIKYVVPISNKLHKKQMQDLSIKNPQFYDYNVNFKDGNPLPIGDEKILLDKASEMYHDLSKESDEFFSFMRERELFDLSARPGKQPGGYSSFLDKYGYPFIFSNFNGTSTDVDVLTHEFGHAFQSYLVRNMKIMDYRQPGYEGCEIHSMSMEFFAYPYADKFFGDGEKKYRYKHLTSALHFLPYGACVDEFQHFVYLHPSMSHEQRCNKWRELEKIYTPHRIYDECPCLSAGKYWMRQLHIFEVPFYYIDYTIAQLISFYFLIQDQNNHNRAWNKYIKYSKLGGRYPFFELLKKAHIPSPFNETYFKKIIKDVTKIIQSFHDEINWK